MINSLNDLIDSIYGVRTTIKENPLTGVIGITPVMILNNNPKRLGIVISNMSANTIYIAPSNAVSASYGIFLAPNGGSITMKYLDDLALVSHDWYAVSSAINSALFIIETVIY